MVLDSRTPDARLQRALYLAGHWDETRRYHKQEDELVVLYARFVRDLGVIVDPIEQERYRAIRPTLNTLYQLLSTAPAFEAARSEESEGEVAALRGPNPAQRDRGLIKALVVADAPITRICELTAYEPAVIQLFEYLAWDVRPRLKARGWLHNQVFPGGVWAESAAYDFERMCIQAAYVHGIEGVERLLDLSVVEDEAATNATYRQFVRNAAKRANTAVVTAPLNSHTAPQLIDGFAKVYKDDRTAKQDTGGSGGRAAEAVQDGVQAAIKTVAFTVHPTTVDFEGPPDEPRVHTLFQAALEQVKAESQLEASP